MGCTWNGMNLVKIGSECILEGINKYIKNDAGERDHLTGSQVSSTQWSVMKAASCH